MSTEELTAEESAALKEMESAPEPEKTEAPQKEAETPEEFQEEVKAEEAERGEAERKPEDKRDEADKKPPEGFVPHQAMHAERLKARQERERADALEKRLEALEKPAEQPPEWKDPLVDPEGHRKWAEHQAQQSQQGVEELRKQQEEVRQQQERFTRAQTAEQEYMQENPDYGNAAKWLHEARVGALRSAGWSDQEISQQIQHDANAVFNAAEQVGMNPAQFLYLRAQAQGYQKAATPAAPAPAGPTDTEKVVALAAAQKATEGIGNTAGEAQEGKLTVAALAEMSEAEMAKIPEADIKRLMGG